MLTRYEAQLARAAVQQACEQLRATVAERLQPDAGRCLLALEQIDKLTRWLTRQIEESGSSS